MSTLRILGRANSFNVRKVLWVCDELGITFTREDWGRGFRPASDPEFLALNPLAMVPCVIDDGHVLRESNTIVRYLASKYGAGRGGDVMYPTDPLLRARIEQWMDWANYETSISLRGAFLGGVLNEPPWNNPWFVETGAVRSPKKSASSTRIWQRSGRMSPAPTSPSPTSPSGWWSTAGSPSSSTANPITRMWHAITSSSAPGPRICCTGGTGCLRESIVIGPERHHACSLCALCK
jgi:Glutathione S-transferase, N-terminal domain